MAVDNLDVIRITLIPNKAHSPLIVDSNAVLPLSIPTQGFQAVSRRNPEIIE
jgi:hypothetical protein